MSAFVLSNATVGMGPFDSGAGLNVAEGFVVGAGVCACVVVCQDGAVYVLTEGAAGKLLKLTPKP